jgi:hypothetical protein
MFWCFGVLVLIGMMIRGRRDRLGGTTSSEKFAASEPPLVELSEALHL